MATIIEQSLVAFTATAALLTVTPGLDTALVLRAATAEGRRAALLAGVGICLGCLAWGAIAAIGLGALITGTKRLDMTRRLLMSQATSSSVCKSARSFPQLCDLPGHASAISCVGSVSRRHAIRTAGFHEQSC